MTQPRHLLFPLALLGFTACLEAPETGSLQVCSGDFELPGEDEGVSGQGTVTALDDSSDCTRSVTLEDEDGLSLTLGLTVTDAAGLDVTPDWTLAEGDLVDFTFRQRMVWGTVSGFVLADAAGLMLAAEEGGWGGALLSEDLEGLEVSTGEEVVAITEGDCLTREGHEIHFQGDEMLTLLPVSSGELSLSGETLTATALRATTDGEGRVCSVSDTTDVTSWMLVR
jgi:hypothetical protein